MGSPALSSWHAKGRPFGRPLTLRRLRRYWQMCIAPSLPLNSVPGRQTRPLRAA